ncbi:Mitochondrial distribution and morphology protein 10 [Colletotrichum orbiculare MAFF 240422]|uniref:Mitochondrial distribution and morphology protein 10 n=1 Tax=Colletotrichum orbiculare (strain 104-T / ATCC 96160 / CBS 514.97 / LARS 414 / MAFF 240422) TaxID=1213857 RepID=A0A484FP12_COLOR|nr:Mitochondrial distribution and morphology protein 10 [Colletotrichum orbiculare MAFF 240422]
MREFMDYVQRAFYEATGWTSDNSLSSLSTPHFATSYQLGSVGVVDGSITYLYSSIPLNAHLTPQSDSIPLPELLRSYRPLPGLHHRPDNKRYPFQSPSAASLFYSRLYLPQSLLEALVLQRVSPALQLQLRAVSQQNLRNGGTLLGIAEYDTGRWALDGLFSTDGGLLGFRGLYHFGGDAENSGVRRSAKHAEEIKERIYGRFSAGGEIYYGTLNKSGGVSVGGRFATLPEHTGTPLTATVSLNPLIGHITTTYAVRAGQHCSLASRFDFNVYSYDSTFSMGMELWRKNLIRTDLDAELSAEDFVRKERSFQAKMEWRLDQPEVAKPRPVVEKTQQAKSKERSFQAKMEWRLDDATTDDTTTGPSAADDEYTSVIKARVDQTLKVGVLWEGRFKSLLFSLGSAIDLQKLDSPFRTLGVEIQYSS